jgi:lipopolysaccharide transport system ATP-binding protein
MSDIAIRVENLGKMFRIGSRQQGYKTFRDSIAGFFKRPGARRKPKSEPFWALKDVSFEIKSGEVVGIIGRNGAGKSTLLKVLSRITEPTEGYAEVHGRVGSLLEVGTGFHPELTGRENVFLNGAILGMRRVEIRAKFDEIVAFAEVEKFIDTPVKHYSSGMYLRLAFAVAANLEPEILLVDEVLAVGDVQFQEKCLGKMGTVAKSGRTVLFVSHNLSAIEALCNRLIVLNAGSCAHCGPLNDGLREYLALQKSECCVLSSRLDRTGTGNVIFSAVSSECGQKDLGTVEAGYGLPLRLVVELKAGKGDLPRGKLDVAVIVRNQIGQIVTTWATFFNGESFHLAPQGEKWTLICSVPSLVLVPDRYRLDLWCAQGPEVFDQVNDAAVLSVGSGLLNNVKDARKPKARVHGSVLISHAWGARSDRSDL